MTLAFLLLIASIWLLVAIVGAWLGSYRNRLAAGLALAIVLGPIGWAVVLWLPKK